MLVRRLTGSAEASIAARINSTTRTFLSIMTVSVTSTEAHEGQATSGFLALTLGSIGVVFGDIGTSPLYAFREAVTHAANGAPVSRTIVLGVLSLILWSLFIVVTAKYVLLLLRADNNGEGGTLSLMALGQRALGRRSQIGRASCRERVRGR